MRFLKFSFFVAACAATVFCGGQVLDSPGPLTSTSITGTVNGNPIVATDTVGFYSTGSPIPLAGVMIWNRPGMCDYIKQGMPFPAGATVLEVTVATASIYLQPVTPGTYAIPSDGTSPDVGVIARDATCATTYDRKALSGTVTLTDVNASVVAGSFDVTFGNGDHLAGTFYGPVCNIDFAEGGTDALVQCNGAGFTSDASAD